LDSQLFVRAEYDAQVICSRIC